MLIMSKQAVTTLIKMQSWPLDKHYEYVSPNVSFFFSLLAISLCTHDHKKKKKNFLKLSS